MPLKVVLKKKRWLLLEEKLIRDLEQVKRNDLKSYKKIMKQLKMLSDGLYFNKEEQWRPLKGKDCRENNIWELKPKPYRLAFIWLNCTQLEIFIFFRLWKKEGRRKKESEKIEKLCKDAYIILGEFEIIKQREALKC
jgi:hypothetical protein